MRGVHIPMVGSALGDALGAGLEFSSKLETALQKTPEDVGYRFFTGSPFGFKPGELTDEGQIIWAAYRTVSALPRAPREPEALRRLMESLRRSYRRWRATAPPDIPNPTKRALARQEVEASWGLWDGGDSAGNGALCRSVAFLAANVRGEQLLHLTALDSSLTHPDPRCIASAVWLAATMDSALDLQTPTTFEDAIAIGHEKLEKSRVLTWLRPVARDYRKAWENFEERWQPAVHEVIQITREASLGDHIDCRLVDPEDWPTGFVLDTLRQAVWAASTDNSPSDALAMAIRHGGNDADTMGAIAGGLIGARFGIEALRDWRPELLDNLRMGHLWPDYPKDRPFFQALALRVQDRSTFRTPPHRRA